MQTYICRARRPGSAEILQMCIARRTGGAENCTFASKEAWECRTGVAVLAGRPGRLEDCRARRLPEGRPGRLEGG